MFPSAQTSHLGLESRHESSSLSQESRRECGSHPLSRTVRPHQGGISQRWNKELFSFWRAPVSCGTGKDWTNPPEAWAATVTRIRDFPSEGFTLNLLPKASPGEKIWTQQSSSFKVTVTFYGPGRRWRMSLSFFLQLPSSLCTGCKNTEQRDLVQESGDLGCRSAPASNELGNHLSLWPHPFPKRKTPETDIYTDYFTGLPWGLDEKFLWKVKSVILKYKKLTWKPQSKIFNFWIIQFG